MSRKKVYLLIIGAGIIAALAWYLPDHTWTVSTQDGTSGGGFGPSKRGLGVSTKTWKSWSGAFVDEFVINYASSQEAREDFEQEMKKAGTIIEWTGRADTYRDSSQRAVKILGDPQIGGAARIIKVNSKESRYVEAASLEWALTFEKSWLKLW